MSPRLNSSLHTVHFPQCDDSVINSTPAHPVVTEPSRPFLFWTGQTPVPRPESLTGPLWTVSPSPALSGR